MCDTLFPTVHKKYNRKSILIQSNPTYVFLFLFVNSANGFMFHSNSLTTQIWNYIYCNHFEYNIKDVQPLHTVNLWHHQILYKITTIVSKVLSYLTASSGENLFLPTSCMMKKLNIMQISYSNIFVMYTKGNIIRAKWDNMSVCIKKIITNFLVGWGWNGW